MILIVCLFTLNVILSLLYECLFLLLTSKGESFSSQEGVVMRRCYHVKGHINDNVIDNPCAL